ncbi:MAG: hypothetical protein V7603_5550 [Micromonosporaceae bacterium]
MLFQVFPGVPVATATYPATASGGLVKALNGKHHYASLMVFMVVVLAHWAEHIAQAIQIWALGWPAPAARGLLGMPFPWLIKQEWLHYGYALLMLIGLALLRPGFVGRSRTWWTVALGIQIWHHFEHLLLLVQALTGRYLLGRAVPTSILQIFFPRVQLHLFYNALVFLPMAVAMYYHLRPARAEASQMSCSCLAPALRALRARQGELPGPA